MFSAILAAYYTALSQKVPIDYELFLHDDDPPLQVHNNDGYNLQRSYSSQQPNDSPRPSALNHHIRLMNANHTNFMSRVNCIEPQHRSPALVRQIQLLESQHEQYLRRILDVEVLTRSDNTLVHRRCARYSTPGLRNDRWLRFNGHHHNYNRTHLSTSRRPAIVRGPRVWPSYRQPHLQRPTHRPTVHLPANRRIQQSNHAPNTSSASPPLNDELSGVDQCNMIQMDDSDFDKAFDDPYFNSDTCNMIHLDASFETEVPLDTILYAASAKIVDTREPRSYSAATA